jgi:RND family efflux transporter MFP subunit
VLPGAGAVTCGACRESRGFDAHAPLLSALQEAVEETLARESLTAWPLDPGNEDRAPAHEKLATLLHASSVSSVPLRTSDERIVGVLLFVERPAENTFGLLSRHGAALAACLEASQRARGGFGARTMRQLHRRWASWRGRAAAAAVLGFVLLLALPWPYRIRCPCQVQPVTRRFVVAPYDGTLESTLASPGDVVRAGDVLARMDAREIQWKLASLQADSARAAKDRDAAMAAQRTSHAQLAELEMERLRMQIGLLEHHLDQIAIRSPIDAIVVAGDLRKVQGAPLTIGQTLFEVAPLEKMNVEVNVPEEEIAHLAPGMPVTLRLDALPEMTLAGTIERIHPQAELRQKQSVFVADMVTDNPQGRLRPGMNGWAEVTGNNRRLGWILFHKPWYRLRHLLAW